MENIYPENYFLVIYFHHYLVDSVSAYYIEKNENSYAIYSKMIELDGAAHVDEKPELERKITEDEFHSFTFMYTFCLKQAERSGGFKGSMEFLYSTYVSKEEFHAVLDEKRVLANAIRKKAEAHRTQLIDELTREGFSPLPSSFNEFIWTAGCKFHKGKHFMFIDTRTNECTCPYGGNKGKNHNAGNV
jgi:hypothetical protein